jgi:hypothetical protein
MVRCVVCGLEKEAAYCYDCEQIRRRTIKQFKAQKKDAALIAQPFIHQNDERQF